MENWQVTEWVRHFVREQVKEGDLVLCQEKVQIKHAFFKVGLPCQSFCFFV